MLMLNLCLLLQLMKLMAVEAVAAVVADVVVVVLLALMDVRLLKHDFELVVVEAAVEAVLNF
jgi:hypothetical protein